VTQNSWGSSAELGSFAWAIQQAAITPEADVIAAADGLQIKMDGATAGSTAWLSRPWSPRGWHPQQPQQPDRTLGWS